MTDSNSTDTLPSESTEVWSGIANVISKSLEVISKMRTTYDLCLDMSSPSVILETEPIRNAYFEVKNRGVKIRILTEITSTNISYCKELMNIGDVRHLEGIKGNFVIADGAKYAGTANAQSKKPLPQLVVSTVKEFVEQQQYFFETLWGKAIPIRQRIKEIEEGAKREFVETIRDPLDIQKLMFDLIKAADNEILILFSTACALRRQENAGALELLKEAATRHNVKIRILVPTDKNNNDDNAVKKRIQQIKNVGIDIRTVRQKFKYRLTVLIVDQSSCLTVELEDDDNTKETSEETIGLATYSNSEATVFSYVSIFENLWIRTELHK